MKTISFLFLLLLFAITGCDLIDNEDDNSSIVPLEGSIKFAVVESYNKYDSVEEPSIFLEMITDKIYPCFNFNIEARKKRRGTEIEMLILGVHQPGVCLTALGPARSRINLGKLPVGNYTLRLSGKDFKDNFRLQINSDKMIISGDINFNSAVRDTSFKFPDNSFAYVYNPDLGDTPIYEDFLDTLKSVINIAEFSFPNYEANPYLLKNIPFGENYYTSDTMRFFRYTAEQDFLKIKEVMTNFLQDHFGESEVAHLKIVNWMNKEILSWTF